ncbi:RidA family protein [Nocardioides sp.]|uniref:RidA family protein n=1 Tax=Nocardioides sp. TaxID=35761 RepID=UPI002614D735|nr:RidA family protein [Nocardioides sp.]
MRPAHEPIVPAGRESEYAEWHLAPAVRVGDTVYCSGVLGTRPDGSVPADLSEEVAQAFENLAEVLAAAGLELAHVVDLLTFHRDLATEVPAFMQGRDRYLAAPWPAWTAIGAAQLGGGLPGVRLEIKATAQAPSTPAAPHERNDR